jgi:hypothetical protein
MRNGNDMETAAAFGKAMDFVYLPNDLYPSEPGACAASMSPLTRLWRVTGDWAGLLGLMAGLVWLAIVDWAQREGRVR